MNNDWNCTVGGLLRRIIWLAAVVSLLYVGLRLMAWANEPVNPPVTTPAGVHGTL